MKTIASWMMAVWMIAGVAGAGYVPDRMGYQALLTDYQGHPIPASSNLVYFRMYDTAEGGNLIWGERQIVHTSTSGLFAVTLGVGSGLGERTEVDTLREAFAADSTVDSRYLELQVVDTNGVIQPPLLPRQRFLSAPYAFQANDAQEAINGFRVSGALFAQQVGTEVNRLIMTNHAAVNTPGGLTVDASGHSGARAVFSSNSTVLAAEANAVLVNGTLTVNGAGVISGAPVFRQGLSAREPDLAKGARVAGGIRALGGYQKIASSVSSLSSRTAQGDGFLLIYLKTDSWDDSDTLNITLNGSTQIPLRHHASTGGASKEGFHFYSTACVPIAKNDSFSAAFDGSNHSHSKFDAYWIPFGF